MSHLKPGLGSRQIWQEIHCNSVITHRVENALNIITGKTNELVVSAHDRNHKSDLTVLSDLYQELDIDPRKKFTVQPDSLQRVQKLVSDSQSESESVAEAVDSFGILIAADTLSDDIIYQTLILKSQYAYWESINSSDVQKLVYFIQTLPRRLSTFIGNVIHATKSKGSWRDVGSSFSRVLTQDITRINPVTMVLRPRGIAHRIKHFMKLPLTVAEGDISGTLDTISNSIDDNSDIIDKLVRISDYSNAVEVLTTLEPILDISNPSHSPRNRVLQVIDAVEASLSQTNDKLTQTTRPSVFVRWWPVLLLLLWYGPRTTRNLKHNWKSYADWIQHNLVDTTVGFFKNWVVKPFQEMFSILRQDQDLSITSRESLQSDSDSLERMLLDYAKDEHLNVTPEQIHHEVVNGDMTMVMSQYEQEIRTPLKSLVKGDLIRSLLIQVQKTKVDGGLAINGIDKLLKSQQLLFGLVSLSPSVFILYKIWGYIFHAKPLMINGKQVNLLCLRSLNSIENYLVRASDGEFCEGDLLVEVLNLIIISQPLIPTQLWNEYVDDLNELNNAKYGVTTKLQLVQKIWNMYGPYLRKSN